MVERVQGETELERLFCFVCTRPSASVFTFSAAVCARCMNRMTRNALNAWDEEVSHGYAP